MTTTNGIVSDDITADETLRIIHAKRAAWLRERKGQEIDYRVQKRIGASPDTLKQIEGNLRDCEIALEELGEIEKEWTAGALE